MPARISAKAYSMRSLDAMWEWPCPRYGQLRELQQSAYCFFGKPWTEAKRKALIWGDSHAQHFAPIVEAATKDQQDAFLLYGSCPAVWGGHVARNDPLDPGYAGLCRLQRENAIKLLTDDPEIKLVILASAWPYFPGLASKDNTISSNDPVDWIEAGLTDLIDRTSLPGRTFIIVGSVPQFGTDPTSCAFADSNLLRAPCRPIEDRSKALEGTKRTDRMILKISSERRGVRAVIPSAPLCADAVCMKSLDGEFLYRDAGHLRRNLPDATKRHLADIIGLTSALAEAPAAPD